MRGESVRQELSSVDCPAVRIVRGKGLLNAIVVDPDASGGSAADLLCANLMQRGLLCKPTHGNIIRLAPPLVIGERDLHECIDIIADGMKEV